MTQMANSDQIQVRPLSILIFVLVLDLLSFTCILPLFPSIFDYYAEKKEQDWLYTQFEWFGSAFQRLIGVPVSDRYNNVFFAGIVGSLFSFLQYLSSPIFGSLSDVYGRKPVLLLSVLGSLASYWLWSISSSFTVFTLSRIIGGLSKASVGIGIAVITDVCPIAKRGNWNGQLYFLVGILMTLIQGSIVRRIPTSKQRNGALFGLAIIVPSYLLLSVAFVPSVLYISLSLYAVSSSLVVPCLTTMVSNECSDTEKGAGMGVLRSLGALSRAIGPLIGSTLFWLLGPSSAYLIGGTLLAIPCYLLYKLPSDQAQKNK
ncbi:hypothetical protein M3Y97_00813800 [Aphelenchoides bicaudatus]|nr:hypothetical protein M3Y97_00813800 [Aphelenchoides bicaudatus]